MWARGSFLCRVRSNDTTEAYATDVCNVGGLAALQTDARGCQLTPGAGILVAGPMPNTMMVQSASWPGPLAPSQ